MAKTGRGQPAHKNAVKGHNVVAKFGNVKGGGGPGSPGKGKGGLSGYTPGKGNMYGPGEHPCAHPEVHHATYGGHKGHLGEHKLANSHQVTSRPMGAYRYSDVFKKGSK